MATTNTLQDATASICNIVLCATLAAALLFTTLVPLAHAAPAVDPAFARTWERTDKAVKDNQVNRTWMWGPEPLTVAITEDYVEGSLANGTAGKRPVQYFDKSRMELTDPDADPDFVWTVTNGLLALELITGRLQTGDQTFVSRDPALIPVAGDYDDPDGPTYATFAALMGIASNRSGMTVNERIDRAGQVTSDAELDEQQIVVGAFDPLTEHNIASPFWDFMNSRGLVYEDGEFVEARLFQDPVFATGRPISEPYWANVFVGGAQKLVLMQCFERRCLTYTPTNATAWQVEAGNIGLHYYTWRYADTTVDRLAYVSDASGNDDIYTVQSDGLDPINLTNNPAQENQFEWSPDGTTIAFVSDRDGDEEIYIINADGTDLRQLTENVDVDDSEPSWSPDGARIAFTTTREGSSQIYIMNADGSDPTAFTQIADGGGWTPRWSPDGSRIAYGSRTDIIGRFATIEIAEVADPLNPHAVNCGHESRFDANWSPSGAVLTYYAKYYQGGGLSFCVVDRDGAKVTEWEYARSDYWPLATDVAAYTPDGRMIANRCVAEEPYLACSTIDVQAGRVFFEPASNSVELENAHAPAFLNEGVWWLFWSSDGKKLAFQGRLCSDSYALCVYDGTREDVTFEIVSTDASWPIHWQPRPLQEVGIPFSD